MAHQAGLEVVVKGDLPRDILAKITVAVQKAVRNEVAAIDLLSGYSEVEPSASASAAVASFGITGFPPGHTLGIIYKPPV